MAHRLAPYGSESHNDLISKVGKKQTPASLAGRMPSAELVAKVGQKSATPRSLARRMPSAEIASKVGIAVDSEGRTARVVRRNAQD